MNLQKQIIHIAHGDEFSIEIKQWKRDPIPGLGIFGECAAIYAVIREGHPLFNVLKDLNDEFSVPYHIPFHNGCTYIEKMTYRGRPSVKIGANYQHFSDEWMSKPENSLKVIEVLFGDAKQLWDFLSSPHCQHEDWADLDAEAKLD